MTKKEKAVEEWQWQAPDDEGVEGDEKVFGVFPPSFREKWGPLFLIVTCFYLPLFIVFLCKTCEGDFSQLYSKMSNGGTLSGLQLVTNFPAFVKYVIFLADSRGTTILFAHFLLCSLDGLGTRDSL
jgi:hypothetical protein